MSETEERAILLALASPGQPHPAAEHSHYPKFEVQQTNYDQPNPLDMTSSPTKSCRNYQKSDCAQSLKCLTASCELGTSRDNTETRETTRRDAILQTHQPARRALKIIPETSHNKDSTNTAGQADNT